MMQTYWPLLTLLAPALITLRGGRSAYVWLSFAAGCAVLYGLVQFTLYQFAQGNTDTPLVVLFETLRLSSTTNRAFHDTYYVVAHFTWWAAFAVPALAIGLLLVVPAHPKRSKLDLWLFWLAALLVLVNAIVQFNGFFLTGMPRRYVDYDETFQRLSLVTTLLSLTVFSVTLLAAARPIISLLRAMRKRRRSN